MGGLGILLLPPSQPNLTAVPKPHLIRKKKISVNTATHNFLLICKKKHNITLKSIKSLSAKTFTRNLSSL